MAQPKSLLNRLLSSNTKAELLTLFNEKPRLSARREQVAKKIGRTPGEIDKDLEDLIKVGIISRKKTRRSEIIQYDGKRAAEIHRILAEYIEKSLE
jgi:predicted transcriptional regulator